MLVWFENVSVTDCFATVCAYSRFCIEILYDVFRQSVELFVLIYDFNAQEISCCGRHSFSGEVATNQILPLPVSERLLQDFCRMMSGT